MKEGEDELAARKTSYTSKNNQLQTQMSLVKGDIERQKLELKEVQDAQAELKLAQGALKREQEALQADQLAVVDGKV